MVQLTDALQKAGLRQTPQRLAICRYLANSREHPTANMIHEALQEEYPSLSLATVYNTLETLVKLGAINTLGAAGDEAVRYDADTSPHVNLACTQCGKVVDLPSQHVRALESEIAALSGYQMRGARLLYFGLCPTCQRRGEA
jgi:Fur family transcriptional regulator, peroxide stress response regulator